MTNSEQKFNEEEVEYIKMLNEHIVRMDKYSFKCKFYCISILSAFYGGNVLIGGAALGLADLRTLSILVSVAFWIMDTNYQMINHRYRRLENDFMQNRSTPFYFKKEETCCQKLCNICKSVTTTKNWPFYLALGIGIYYLNR